MKLLPKDTLLTLGMFRRLMSLSGQSLVSCANSGTLTAYLYYGQWGEMGRWVAPLVSRYWTALLLCPDRC